jgi:hypothetical protein
MTEEVKIERREARKLERKKVKELKEMEAYKNQKPVKEMTITIEWKKSRMYGYCPTACAKVEHYDGTYTYIGDVKASGYGYDKESTVVATIFNAALRYELYRKIANEAPYGVRYYDGDGVPKKYINRDGKEDFHINNPTYNGGVGMECYYRISEFIGGELEKIASGDSFDAYKYTDKKEL